MGDEPRLGLKCALECAMSEDSWDFRGVKLKYFGRCDEIDDSKEGIERFLSEYSPVDWKGKELGLEVRKLSRGPFVLEVMPLSFRSRIASVSPRKDYSPTSKYEGEVIKSDRCSKTYTREELRAESELYQRTAERIVYTILTTKGEVVSEQESFRVGLFEGYLLKSIDGRYTKIQVLFDRIPRPKVEARRRK